MMTMLQIRQATGMPRKLFAKIFGFPVYTLINWELGKCRCPDYVINLTLHFISTDFKFSYLNCEHCMNKSCPRASRCGFVVDCEERQVFLIDG